MNGGETSMTKSGGEGLPAAAFEMAETIRRMFEPHAKKIAAAFIFGSLARGTHTARSDNDLMIIGELDYDTVYAVTDEAAPRLGRQVSPVLISPEDWRGEVAMREAFVSNVRRSPKLFVFGSEKDL
jgi:predicted nucleotidyltransferase